MSIKIKVNNKIASLVDESTVIVCGNNDYDVEFIFDEEWNSYLVKTARFVWNGQFEDVAFIDNTCKLPKIQNTLYVAVGLYAGDLITTTPALINAKKSILCDNPIHADPPEDVYNQIMELISSGAIKGEKGDKGDPGEKGETGERGERGEKGERGIQGERGLQGEKGDTGEKGEQGERGLQGLQGEQGEKGEDGYTPVKGTDYFTAADIAEIVEDVIEEIPETYTKTEIDAALVEKANKAAVFTQDAPLQISIVDNSEYYLTNVANLTVTYPASNFETWVKLTTAASGTITITLPTSQYIGTTPTFGNSETWEISIKNGVIATAKVGDGT